MPGGHIAVLLRFARTLSREERNAFDSVLLAAGACAAHWAALEGASLTLASTSGDPDAIAAALPEGCSERCRGCLLAIEPEQPEALGRLLAALGGAARPAGVREAIVTDGSLVVLWDDARSPLSLLLDIVDVETDARRTIRLLLPLSDDSLARLGAALLGLQDFDAGRFIETHLAKLGVRC
jgi:hypothetical protein